MRGRRDSRARRTDAGRGGIARSWALRGLVALASGCAAMQTPEQNAYGTAVNACHAGDGDACYSAAMTALEWEGRAPEATAIAELLLVRGCDLRNLYACRRMAERWGPVQPGTAAIYRQRACAAGDTESCARQVVVDSAEAPSPAATAAAVAAPEPTMVSGSCFFAAKGGLAVTNHHVIEGAAKIMVVDAAGRVHVARVLRDDPQVDLAVLEAVTASEVAPLPLADDRDAKLGQAVFTIGFPVPGVLGTDPKFSEGSIGGRTGLGAAWLYQITVPVQPGNSGGPLVDERGAVVGVIVAKLRADRLLASDGVAPENVNFAVKSAELRRFIRGLKGSTARPTRTRQAAIDRTQAAVCQVVAELGAPAGTVARAPDAPAPPANGAAPADPHRHDPPAEVDGGASSSLIDMPTFEDARISGEWHVVPDPVTVSEMRRRGSGAVSIRIKVCIDAEGAVTQVTMLDSSGFTAYDERLVAAVRQWRYRPHVVDGKAAPVCGLVGFTYRPAAASSP
ncbi:MAG: TonB family protein [Kofleriaceae bacterium]